MEQTEASLVAKARAGEATAVEAVLESLIPPGYRLALSILGDSGAAEDAVQEAATKAWLKIHQLRPDALTMKPWFLKIVANECKMTWRRPWWSLRPAAQPENTPGLGDEERWITSLDLRTALRLLPAEDRVILMLFYGLDLTLEEVAETVSVSKAAARSRLYRALGRLRDKYTPKEEPR